MFFIQIKFLFFFFQKFSKIPFYVTVHVWTLRSITEEWCVYENVYGNLRIQEVCASSLLEKIVVLRISKMNAAD